MTVQVKTFGSISEAAAALASDRAARFFSGGTLLMRAINEGDTTIATLVRATDPAYCQIRNEGARITIGAGVRMVDILASRELAFLHPVARVVGGPAVRAMATVPRSFFRPLVASFLIGALFFFWLMSGSMPPPWIMKPGITRWKISPSKKPSST